MELRRFKLIFPVYLKDPLFNKGICAPNCSTFGPLSLGEPRQALPGVLRFPYVVTQN